MVAVGIYTFTTVWIKSFPSIAAARRRRYTRKNLPRLTSTNQFDRSRRTATRSVATTDASLYLSFFLRRADKSHKNLSHSSDEAERVMILSINIHHHDIFIHV